MFLVREIVLNNIPAIFTMFRMFLFLVSANAPKENTKKTKTQFQHAWYKLFVFQSMLFHSYNTFGYILGFVTKQRHFL